MADLIRISSSAFADSTHVVAFRAREALGSPYELEIFLTVPIGEELDVAEAAGARATLTVDRSHTLVDLPTAEKPMHWSGLLLEVSILAEIGQRSLVRALLVPRLYRAAQTHHSRIFTDESLVDIAKTLLDKNGLRDGDGFDATGLAGDYPKEEHVAQWGESDLDFLHRWFEREGIHYHFEQDGEAEKLLLVDKNPSPEPIAARYHPLVGGDATAGACVTRFRCDARSLVGVVKVVDRDYANPSLPMNKEGDVSDFPGEYVLSHARLVRTADVDRIARVRQESMKVHAKTYRAEATLLGLSPGALFHLEDHPRSGFAKDYLVTEAEHVGWNETPGGELAELIELEIPKGPSSLYTVRLSAIEKETPFRLSKRTSWPRIDGYETATIDGPAESDYAQIDDMGRYLVRYHADESMGEDAKVSTWIRMMQPHTGAPEGMHFPLRKGTEVLVAFLGGDPDRPVILGAVPNAVTPSVVTKSNHTQNRLFTGGGTTLEIEDKAGGQYVHWYTPVDHTHFHMGAPRKVQGKEAPEHATKASLGWSTDGNAVLSVGGEWDVGVGAKLHEIVKGEVVEEYETSRKETVNGPVTEQYDGDHKLTVDKQQTYVIKTGKDDTISAGWKQTITGGWTQKVDGGWTQTSIAGGWAQPSISGGWTQTISGGWTQQLTGNFTQVITGSEHRTITADQMQVVAGNSTLLHGGSILQIIGGGQTIIAPSLKTLGAAWQQIDASSDDIKGKATSVVGFDLSIKGIEYGVKGVEIAGKLAELSDKVFEASLVGVSISRKGFENTNEATSFTMGGVYMKIKGLLGIT
jgi:type VI secretion system secreted protein VgrG